MKLAAAVVVGIVALFYAYGAAVHVFNMLSMTGFDWSSAPMKWQVLDVAYLILDAVVVLGVVLGWRAGYAAFYVAAVSQIVLYTLLREWIIDVPPEFAVSDEQRSYLTVLVVFHAITLVLVTLSLRVRSTVGLFRRTAADSSHK